REPQSLTSPTLSQVPNHQRDAVPCQQVTRELAYQRTRPQRTKRPGLSAIQQHALGIAVRAEMNVVAVMERPVQVNRNQKRDANRCVHDEVVDAPPSRDESVNAVMAQN